MSGREQIDKAFEILRDCFRAGGKLLLCGNGGSAADCEHIVGELMKGMHKKRDKHYYGKPYQGALPAISLCSQYCLITAIANDIGGEFIYAQQVFGYGKRDDVLLAISTSGRSSNILHALEVAKSKGMKTIGLTSQKANPDFIDYCDAAIVVAAGRSSQVQEMHIKIYHELCQRLEEEFYP